MIDPEPLPHLPGCYLFKDALCEVIYVGKARDLETLWESYIFGLCGVGEVYRRTFSVVVTSTPEERRGWLAEVREIVGRRFPARGGEG